MMKYTIKRKRLPQARFDQVYTLTIYMGYLGNDGSSTREAKVQYPVISHREGLCKYRELIRMQRVLDAQETIAIAQPAKPKVIQPTVAARTPHAVAVKASASKRSAKHNQKMAVAV